MHSPLLKNRMFLYATEFFCGMSAMAVELGASRLLAPYFSSSQVIWTIIIATIMIAMSIGNVLGGKWADRDPDPGRLYRRMIIAGIWIACIPFAGRFIIPGISLAIAVVARHGFLIWASFACCLILFVFPLVLLGTVTPSLTKYAVDNLEDNGRTVGLFIALNTIGSIIGTFLPTFVTIPAAGTAATFVIFSLVPVVLGVLYFVSVRRHKGLCAVGIITVVACALLTPTFNFVFWNDTVVHEDESIYNYLQVTDTPTRTALSTNVAFGIQSVKPKAGELTGMYYDYALAAPYMAGVAAEPQGKEMLVLGLGSGTYATQCLQRFDGLAVTGVEIDEKIVGLASEYFDMDERVDVIVGDGRASLATLGSYDVIMVDAYQDITIPFQLSSVEFFTQVREHLKPGGVMVVNMNMRDEGKGSINEYLTDTICAVFGEVYTVETGGTGNVELFASDNPKMLSVMQQGLVADSSHTAGFVQRNVAPRLVRCEGGGLILTDDKAPVELLGMRALDGIISSELDYYHGVYEREGFDGLMSAI